MLLATVLALRETWPAGYSSNLYFHTSESSQRLTKRPWGMSVSPAADIQSEPASGDLPYLLWLKDAPENGPRGAEDESVTPVTSVLGR